MAAWNHVQPRRGAGDDRSSRQAEIVSCRRFSKAAIFGRYSGNQPSMRKSTGTVVSGGRGVTVTRSTCADGGPRRVARSNA